MDVNKVIELKGKVKNEMLRRNGYGSVSNLGSDTYDYNVQPQVGEMILEEHGKKIIDPLLAITDHGDLSFVRKDDPIPESFNEELIDYVDALSNEDMTGSSSSCRGACTGLCLGTCTTGCSGCSSSCTGCSGTCQGQCDTNCNGCVGCSTGCANSCQGCSSTCGTGCTGGAMTI